MDLVDEILKFSSAIQKQEDDPLRAGLTLIDDTDPGTPASQATPSRSIIVRGWPKQREELRLEMQRLSMWRSDVLDQNIDQSFKVISPLHTVVKHTILHIARTMLGWLISEDSGSPLSKRWYALKNKVEHHSSVVQSRQPDEDGRPLIEFRSRQSSMSSNAEEDEVLSNLSDSVQRLKDMLNGLIVVDVRSPGKRPRRQDSMHGIEKLKRTRFASNDSSEMTIDYRTGRNIGQPQSTIHLGVEKMTDLESAFRDSVKILGDSVSSASENPRKGGGDSLPGLSTTCSMLQLLSKIDAWKIYTCKHSSSVIVPAVTATCVSLFYLMLESLQTMIKQFRDSGSLDKDIISSEQLRRLKTSLNQYMECSRTAQLEKLLNETSAPAAAMSKARRAMSNAIDSICKIRVTASKEGENMLGENGHKAGVEVFSLAVNVVAIVETVIKLLAALQRAQERQQDLPKVLKTYSRELQNTRDIVEIVLSEDALHISTIMKDLNNIDDCGNNLKQYLIEMSKERNAFQQYTHQLLKGSKDTTRLSDVMKGLNLSRNSLVLKIQVVHVGLTKAYGNAIEGITGGNWVCIEFTNLKRGGLCDDTNTTLAGDEGVTEKNIPRGGVTRVVVQNKTRGLATMINAPVGKETAQHLTIDGNEASDKSFMLNYGTEWKDIKRLTRIHQDRVESSDSESEDSSDEEYRRRRKTRKSTRRALSRRNKRLQLQAP
ncbi:hypothetical protein diail_11669 [Diaporthe ilicicola]|nr:hypothetical protein diail_11669 [Diaporthe ilicicola]